MTQPETPNQQPSQRTDNSYLGKIALEVFSIVLGVMLALGLSEWAEDRKNQSLAETALSAVENELTSNLTVLRLIHANNEEVVESIEAGPSTTETDMNFIPGIQLLDAAWNAMLASGLTNHIDFETISSLAEIYSVQTVYKQTSSQMIEASMNLTAYSTALGTTVDNDHYSRQFLDTFKLLLGVEAQLLSFYEEQLEQPN